MNGPVRKKAAVKRICVNSDHERQKAFHCWKPAVGRRSTNQVAPSVLCPYMVRAAARRPGRGFRRVHSPDRRRFLQAGFLNRRDKFILDNLKNSIGSIDRKPTTFKHRNLDEKLCVGTINYRLDESTVERQ